MPRVSIPYKKIDHLMGNPKRHEGTSSGHAREDLRVKFVALCVKALCPSIHDPHQSVSDNNRDAIMVQIWNDKEAMALFNKLVNFDEDLVYFNLDKSNVLQYMDWLLKNSDPSKYEITTLLGNDLCLIFSDNDEAMRFKLSYAPE